MMGTQEVAHSPQSWTPPLDFDGYHIQGLLGRGGMGAVYLAEDTLLKRWVAIKFIHGAHAGAREMFVTEARAAARLQHSNVVSIYRIGEIAGLPYIVSEYIRGQSLDRLARPISWQQLLKIGIGLAAGLAAAHRRGILHRDIKPSNAILGPDDEVKLLDFGLAKFTELSENDDTEPDGIPPLEPLAPVTRPGDGALQPLSTVKGTPAYMAPEVMRGTPASTRSDIYSLGALLYALCSDGPPFRRLPWAQLIEVMNRCDATPLSQVAPKLDARFAALIDRCLRRNPLERFESAEALREALQELQAGRARPQLPEGNPYRGLLPFEAEHRSVFFGRQAEIGSLVDRLRTEPSLLVVADSGIGKSSLIRAGVLPAVCDGALGDERVWRQATITPGRSPRRALIASLGELLSISDTQLSATLAREPRQLGRLVAASLGSKMGAVLFIDQLEELVTLSRPEEAAWVSEELASLHGGVKGFRILMTARADYLSRLGAFSGLGEDIGRAFYLLRPLLGDGLKEVIVGPARCKGVEFESEALVSQLISSTMHSDSGLPLLQFALAELWEARTGNLITKQALETIGGVAGALERHADMVLGRLGAEQRTTARRILMALVSVTGMRVRRSEEELLRTGPAASSVLAALVGGRLLVARQTPEGPIYEVAHESLVAGWGSLRRWLDEYQEKRAIRHRLESASAEWLRLGKAREALWGAQQIAEVRLLEKGEVGPREQQFLDASIHSLQRRQRLRQGLVLLGILLTLISYGVYRDRVHVANEQLRRASQLGQEASEIEWFLRTVYELPLHDTSREQAPDYLVFPQPPSEDGVSRWIQSPS